MRFAMSSLRQLSVLAVVLLGVSVVACRTAGSRRANDGTAVTTLDVDNQDFNDMTVYVLVNGQRTRLGIATGNKTTTFTIPAYLVTSTSYLRFVCDPIGGDRTPVSEEINTNPGDQLVMIVRPGG